MPHNRAASRPAPVRLSSSWSPTPYPYVVADEAGAGTFARMIRTYVDSGVIARDASVFVQFAGQFDEEVCAAVGLTNVEFGNIAPGSASTGPTAAARFDAHRMPQADGSFDHVLAHAGLHHCSRPHEALHEMYRLARRTVLFVENQESSLMRAAMRAGVVLSFELAAVRAGSYSSGGVDGTGVPNYVWRWTPRELSKAVAAYDPGLETPIEIRTEWNVAVNRVSSQILRRKLHLPSDESAAALLTRGQRLANLLVPGQGNIFAAMIRKDLATLRPWMASSTAMHR